VLQQPVDERTEELGVAAREQAGADQVDHVLEALVALVELARPVAARFERRHLLRRKTEEKEILRAHLLAQLDVRAIERADRERAVHAELHIARAGGLLAGGRDLLGQVGGGDDFLGERHTVVG